MDRGGAVVCLADVDSRSRQLVAAAFGYTCRIESRGRWNLSELRGDRDAAVRCLNSLNRAIARAKNESRLDMELTSLIEAVERRICVDDTIRAALQALASFLEGATWTPDLNCPQSAEQAVMWGFVMCEVAHRKSFHPLCRKVASQIAANGQPHPHDFAELSAGALVRHILGETDWRASSKGNGPRRTDLVVVVDDTPALPIEVTTAAAKAAALRARELANSLSAKLATRLTSGWDIVVHVGRPAGSPDVDELLVVTERLSLGEEASVPPRWNYVSKPIDPATPPQQLLPFATDDPPSWWSSDHARSCCLTGHLAGPHDRLRPAQVRIFWPSSVDGFINPLQKKVNHFQGEKDAPFVVAMDVQGLGLGAFSWYEKQLPRWFATDGWQHLSGVLIFSSSVHWSAIGWTWRLHLNPRADVPITLTDQALAQCLKETRYNLTFQKTPGTPDAEA